MSNILNIETIESKKFKVKNNRDYENKIFHISRKDKTTINSVLFKDIFNSFSKKYGAENIIVRGLTNTMPYTFKSYGETSLNFQEFHEYFENRVKDTSQFEYFYNIEIQVRVF